MNKPKYKSNWQDKDILNKPLSKRKNANMAQCKRSSIVFYLNIIQQLNPALNVNAAAHAQSLCGWIFRVQRPQDLRLHRCRTLLGCQGYGGCWDFVSCCQDGGLELSGSDRRAAAASAFCSAAGSACVKSVGQPEVDAGEG